MKHKIIVVLLFALLLLCACNNVGTQIEPNESTFLVNFHHDCSDDIYGIHFEYYLDGTPIGGGVVGNANGSKLSTKDVLVKDFISDDFPENAELSQFELELFVVDKNGDEYQCNSVLNFSVEYGKTYDISIAGSYKEGFSAKQIENPS